MIIIKSWNIIKSLRGDDTLLYKVFRFEIVVGTLG